METHLIAVHVNGARIAPLVRLAFLYMVAPGIGDYFEFAQSISCFLGDEEVSCRPLMGAENVTAIIKGREVLGDSWQIEDNLTVLQEIGVGKVD
jgi:hypothetical protein